MYFRVFVFADWISAKNHKQFRLPPPVSIAHAPDENGEHGGSSLRGPFSAASGPLELRDINYESHTPIVY